MTLDPTGIEIESNAPPIWEQDEDFSEVMSNQLKHAPWLAISILAHVIAGFILYFALDNPRILKPEVMTAMEPAIEEDDIEEDEIDTEDVKDEVTDEVDTVDPEFSDSDEVVDNVINENISDSDPTAFRFDGTNPTIGLGGDAGGRFGRGGGGPNKGRHPRSAKQIDAALKWLRVHQDDSGRWDCDAFMKHDKNGAICDGAGNPVHDVGVTGLALLAFLGDGNTMRSGKYKNIVRKAVKWLRLQQAPSGLFGTAASHDFIYDHAIASYAMCEAYGLSNYKLLRKIAQGGINYLESHRNPYACWRYQPRDNDNDMSVTGWCIMAYKSAKDFGLDINTQALKTSLVFLDELTDMASGHCGYTQKGELSSRHPGDHAQRFPIDKGDAMTAVGLFCRFFLGQEPKKVPVMKAAAETLLQRAPVWDKEGSIDHYYWYYGSYALYQMGPPYWKQWQNKLTPALVKTQRTDGNFKGSWDNVGAWGEDGGRVYSTAILALTLEAYYRYTRLVR